MIQPGFAQELVINLLPIMEAFFFWREFKSVPLERGLVFPSRGGGKEKLLGCPKPGQQALISLVFNLLSSREITEGLWK